MPLSGPAWVAKFPGSKSVDDLAEPFQTRVANFLASLQKAGAEVKISATLRPLQRAYLMHHCFLIAKGQIAPAAVPPMPGVDIEWVHPSGVNAPGAAASLAAAAAMAESYGIVFAPVLASLHTQGLAIDMTISWDGNLTIIDATGLETTISTLPRDGGNRDLRAIGETFGVLKLLTDPPHWSSTGH